MNSAIALYVDIIQYQVYIVNITSQSFIIDKSEKINMYLLMSQNRIGNRIK